jgi:hypothetical protein
MSDGDQGDFGHEYEVNSQRSHIAAYVLIAGLILEVINAFIWFHGPETIAGIVAVLLIVGGVWGEVHFAHRARIAGDKQLAQYEARTAEATARAEEARLELARLTTPRVISDEQKRGIMEAITPFAATPFILLMQPEPEPMALMEQLSDALVEAGWNWLSWPGPIAFTQPGKPSVGMMTGVGIRVQLASSKRADWEQPVLALANALHAAGLEDVAAQESEDGSVAPTAVHVRIGRKP